MILRNISILFKPIQQYKYQRLNKLLINLNINKNEIINKRYLHLTILRKTKLFIDHENQYAHNVLEKIGQYSLCLAPITDELSSDIKIDDILSNTKDKTAHELFEEFKLIVNYCKTNNICISNDQFDEFIDAYTDNCYKLSDHELLESIKYMKLLPATSSIYDKNFIELWSVLDEETCERIDKWKLNQILYCCECWYSLNLVRKSNFVSLSTNKFNRKIRKLNKNETVHSIFFCNLLRKQLHDMIDYELTWKKYINEMTIEEIGIMSMGFFKTKTKIHNPELIKQINNRLLNELDNNSNNIKEITLVSILKILRYSTKINEFNLLYQLMEKLSMHIDKFSLLTCLHIGLLGIDLQLCHDKTINLIINRFYNEIENARLKDLERLTHIMSLYNISNTNGLKDNLCKKIFNEIPKRIDEIVLYPKCLATLLHYSTLCGNFNEEYISIVLDMKFLQYAYGNMFKIGREIFILDSFTRINLADSYNGNQLDQKYRGTMGKLLTHYIPERNSKFKLTVTDRILLEVKETCDELYKICKIKHVLPHFQRPDIIICYDKEKKEIIKLGENYTADYRGVILTKENMFDNINNMDIKNIETIIIVINSWNNYVRDTERLTGIAEMKLKQIKLLNHNYIDVPWFEWTELENQMDRQKYIKRKLYPILGF